MSKKRVISRYACSILFIILQDFEPLLTIVDVANIVKSRLSKKISLLLLIWRNTNLGGTLPLSRPLIIKRHHLTLTHFIANITLQRGGIWKAKFQIPPLRSVMFAVNTTTRAASNLDYLQFCSSQPLLSPGTVHQKFE